MLQTYLELSTAHLTAEVAALLDVIEDTTANRCQPTTGYGDWRDSVVVCPYRYGFWVREFLGNVDQHQMPKCLADCLRYAGAQGAIWLLFDQGADTIADLTTHDW